MRVGGGYPDLVFHIDKKRVDNCSLASIRCASPKLGAVVRQNFSRGSKRGGSGGVGVNTIIDSVQQEDPKGASPVRVERAYIRIYKGPAESRSELCRSIVTMVRPSEPLL